MLRFLFSMQMLCFSAVIQSLNGIANQLCDREECTENTTSPTPSCPRGYYGSNCTYKCSDHCIGSHCEASKTGVWVCIEGCIHGYWRGNCRSECAPICDGCDRVTGGCIACKPSAKCEEKCHELCPNSYCQCTETSQEPCSQGKFGSKCQWGCPEFCQDNICNRKSGLCISGCKKGYFGSKCENKCNRNCREGKCTIDGNCRKGCNPGFYGEFCELQCSENCRLHTCDKLVGVCTSGCDNGYFGPGCNRTCPGCALCDGKTGLCLGGDADNKGGNQLILISTVSFFIIILAGFIIIVLLYRSRSRMHSRQQYLTTVAPMTLPVSVNVTYNEAYDIINEQVLEHLSNSTPTIFDGSSTENRKDETDFPTRNPNQRSIFHTL